MFEGWQYCFKLQLVFLSAKSLWKALENQALADRYFSSLFHSMWLLGILLGNALPDSWSRGIRLSNFQVTFHACHLAGWALAGWTPRMLDLLTAYSCTCSSKSWFEQNIFWSCFHWGLFGFSTAKKTLGTQLDASLAYYSFIEILPFWSPKKSLSSLVNSEDIESGLSKFMAQLLESPYCKVFAKRHGPNHGNICFMRILTNLRSFMQC